jgi:hypothetical protein
VSETLKELLITSKYVVEDSSRTLETCTVTQPNSYPAPGTYSWSFGYLMTQIAKGQGVTDPVAISNAVLNLFKTWETTQDLGGGTTPLLARPLIDQYIINPWMANTAAAGKSGVGPVDLNLAPFRLLAIVNRIDQRDVDAQGVPTDAGGARFVFGAVYNTGVGAQQICATLPFTFIFEYTQPASSQAQLMATANAWHALSSTSPQSAYNTALQAITDGFSKSQGPGSPVLTSARTNEIALAPTNASWEMRELGLGSSGFSFTLVPTSFSPDASMNGTAALASVMQQYNCPNDQLPPGEIQGSSAPNPPFFWSAPGVTPAQRENFALNATCNGCHQAETATFGFTHVVPRDRGVPSALSSFLTGCPTVGALYCPTGTYTVIDPVNPGTAPSYTTYSFNDLHRRAAYFTQLLSQGSNSPGGFCINH